MHTTHGHDDSDTVLMEAVVKGDRSAFERLYEAYATRVFQYVRTLVGDPDLAEEVVTDTMLAVWRGAGTFAYTSRLSTWMFGIARHKALDAMRRRGKRQRETPLDDVAMELPHPGEPPIEGIHRRQVADRTRRALAVLSPEHQEILRLVFYEDLPYDEIAMLLGIPTNTVKTRVYYAKHRLREYLERSGLKDSTS